LASLFQRLHYTTKSSCFASFSIVCHFKSNMPTQSELVGTAQIRSCKTRSNPRTLVSTSRRTR
jgi:hypothetical protein